MLDVLCASSRRCLLQSCTSNISSLITIIDVLLDMSAVHETTKSKIITKFTGLRNVILLSRLSDLQLFVCQCMQCVGGKFFPFVFIFSHLVVIVYYFSFRSPVFC